MTACPKCRKENPSQAKFCSHCGSSLKTAQLEAQSGKEDRAERRQLTIFFCDLVDSTPLSERMDPEDYRQMILDYHNAAEEVINRFGGKVGNYIGDGLLVYFGYPQGLENAAITGVQTARAVIEALDRVRGRWEDPEKNIFIKVRVGMHTGLVIVDDHLALGETVNLAARLEGLAPHNGIVVSPQTVKLIKGWFEVKSLGKKSLKGISEPLEVFEVIGETGARTKLDVSRVRGLSPLVGRDEEIEVLRQSWSRAQNGEGLARMVLGEAGIGKSRLLDKLEAEVHEDDKGVVLEARCSMYHTHSAFYPLLEVIQNDLLGIKASDENQQRLEKLEHFFKNQSQDWEEQISLFAEYFGISSEVYLPLPISPFAKRDKIMGGISSVLLDLAQKRPVLFVVEDLHWSDASTLEWLEYFRERLTDKALFLLCTTRPHPKGDPTELPAIDLIELTRLESSNTERICLHQARGKSLPAEVLKMIVAKTEGVPLFVEELTKMILESDRLEEKEDHYEMIGPLEMLDIPSTLQDSLLARLDQLKDVKDIVQMGSVIGREFSLDMLRAALPDKEAKLTPGIQKLLNAEILQYSEKSEEPVYQFKHALIQDTAYGSMLRSRRRQMHEKVATILPEKFPDICENQPEQLAHHLTEADELAKAIPQWLKAGQQAKLTNATQEAISHLNKGLALLPKIKDQSEAKNLELDLLLTLGGTYMVSHGFPHPLVKKIFNKARAIAETMEVSPKLALMQAGLMGYYFNTEDYKSYDELCEYMMTLAQHPDHGYWFDVLSTYFTGIAMVRGTFAKAHLNFERVTKIFDPSKPFPWELTPGGYLPFANQGWWMICLQFMGYMDHAKRISEQQLKSREEFRDSDSMTLYHIHTFPALYSLEAREWEATETILDSYLPIVREFGDPVFILTAEVYYYLARAFQGDHASFEKVVQLMDVCFDIGFKTFAVTLSPFVAEGHLIHGNPVSALNWIEKILSHIKQTGTDLPAAELIRLKGMALHELNKPSHEVEQLFENAIDIAREQEAKTFELRAIMNLARLWIQQDKPEEALSLLKECYDWFTEGLDSIDLQQAKSLLQALETTTRS